MSLNHQRTRRDFLHASLALGTGLAVTGCAAPGGHAAAGPKAQAEGEEDVSPAEDLMREHGVLKRVLLVYEAAALRLEAGQECPPEPIADAAHVIRTFIEDYHEKLEEDFLFPRFRKAHTLVELVDVLEQQHQAGRRLTAVTLQLAMAPALREAAERRRLVDALRAFIRMYSPHEAREDTVLFPALRKIVSPHEYDALGDDFERKEHELFGADGFEGMVERVARIEKTLGLYDLAQFTPKA